METPQNTPKALYRILKIMYAAILIGTIMYIGMAYTFSKQSGEIIISDKLTIQYMWSAVLILTLVIIPSAYYFYKKKIVGMDMNMDLIQKLIFYKTPFIIRLAMLEACCIIDTTFFLVTSNNYILYAAIIVLIILFMNYPSKSTISNDLKLNAGESEQL